MVRFLPPLIARMQKEGTKLRLDAVPLGSLHFAAKLEAGDADLALGAFPKAPQGLRRQRLYFDGYVSVARKARPGLAHLKGRKGFFVARHIVVTASDAGHAAHQMVQDALEAALAPEQVLLRLPSFVAAALVASRTDGVATLPANLATFVAEQLGLAIFRCPIRLPPIEIAQYWHARYQRDPGHQWLRHVCFDLFARSKRPLSDDPFSR